jgi:hypothetical protein
MDEGPIMWIEGEQRFVAYTSCATISIPGFLLVDDGSALAFGPTAIVSLNYWSQSHSSSLANIIERKRSWPTSGRNRVKVRGDYAHTEPGSLCPQSFLCIHAKTLSAI